MQLVVMHTFDPTLVVPMALLIGAAALILTCWRWTPLVGAALCGVLAAGLLAPALPHIVYELRHPGTPMGPFLFVLLPLLLVGVAAGSGATVQNYRRPADARRAPRWLPMTLVALVGVALGAATLHTLAAPAGGTGVSSDVLQSLPAITTSGVSFQQPEIRVKAGELAAFRLSSGDGTPHSFDIDAFGVHVPINAGEDTLALFRPTAPGTYTFYCMPHYNQATGEGMHGTLIVEP
jgi:heme/copper-type cytochrome/quinol oxidase subunit 2